MPVTIGPRKRARLIRDIFDTAHDVVALAKAHRLSPLDLAAWIDRPENRRCLASLRTLADMQAQWMLSRHRLAAATKLIEQATGDDAEVTAEQARKACVELLKLDLKRADDIPTP